MLPTRQRFFLQIGRVIGHLSHDATFQHRTTRTLNR